MARGAAIASLLATGCGRFGFDDLPRDDAVGADGRVDAVADSIAPSRTCSASRVLDLDLAPQAPVLAIAGTGTPSGYALAFRRGDRTAVDGIVVSPELTLATPGSPSRATPVAGAETAYDIVVLQWDGAQIVGGLVDDQGTHYWKVFPDTMGRFLSATEEPSATPASPFLATIGSGRYATSFRGPIVGAFELDAGGVPTTVRIEQALPVDVVSAGVVGREGGASIAVVEGRGAGVVGLEMVASGSWPTFVIDPEGARPSVVGTASAVYVTYARGDDLVATAITSASLAVGEVEVVVPRVPAQFQSALVDGGHRIVGWEPGGFFIAGYKLAEIADVSGLPAGSPDAWTLVEREGTAIVFAAYGAELWTIRVCI